MQVVAILPTAADYRGRGIGYETVPEVDGPGQMIAERGPWPADASEPCLAMAPGHSRKDSHHADSCAAGPVMASVGAGDKRKESWNRMGRLAIVDDRQVVCAWPLMPLLQSVDFLYVSGAWRAAARMQHIDSFTRRLLAQNVHCPMVANSSEAVTQHKQGFQ